MLEDRDYMRDSMNEPRVSVTVILLIVNAIVFIVQLANSNTSEGLNIQDTYFKLSLDGLEHGYIWQLLTFQFMHGSWTHLIFNSLVLFFFGRAVEGALGGRKFVTLYFSSGIIGGLLQMGFVLLFPSQNGAVVGASAGISGLIGAFALMNWAEPFTMIFYFIPLTMRGKTLFWVTLALTVGGMILPFISPPKDQVVIANAAHLGGLLAGFFYIRQIVQGRWHLPQLHLPPRRPPMPRELAVKRVGKKPFWNQNPAPRDEEVSADEYLQKEVDPILDKISAHGIQSLTARERQILEKARSKMNKP